MPTGGAKNTIQYIKDFWSEYADMALDTVDDAEVHGKTVIIPAAGNTGIPVGATITEVRVAFKWPYMANSDGSTNAINVATCQLEVQKSGGSYTKAMGIPNNSWKTPAASGGIDGSRGGDFIRGNIDISSIVDGAGTYNLQIASGKVDSATLTLYDVAWGLEVEYTYV